MRSRRRKVGDYVHVHEFASGFRTYEKAIRVRIYEAEGEIPLVVLSASDDPTQNVTQDVERIAAEVLLKEYPERARRARRRERWFILVEHLPPAYDLTRSREDRRDVFCCVEFDDYRITVAGSFGLRRRVRDAKSALEKHTCVRHGVERLTLGAPSWRLTTREEVE